jgi:hypothetical protein
MWEDRRLRDITEADIQQIVNSGLEEHLQLEYKSAMYEANDRGGRECLLDICMFANSGGGILLIGVNEQRDANGQPTGIPDPNSPLGVEVTNSEQLLQSYDARVVASIQERLPLELFAIPVATERYVIAIRVPNSMLKPHRVHYQGHVYFPSRRERQRYEMDVREIKEMVMRTASRIEQAQGKLTDSLREMERQAAITDLVIGILPVFWQNFMLDVRNRAVLDTVTHFHLGKHDFVQPEFTFDGLQRRILSKQFSFVRLHRDGLIVAKIELPITMQGTLYQLRPTAIDLFLRSFVECSSEVYSAASINGPFLLSMALRTVSITQSLYPAIDFPTGEVNGGRINGGIFPFPVMEADNLVEIDRITRPLCDQAHQMFGRDASPFFTSDGVWMGRIQRVL